MNKLIMYITLNTIEEKKINEIKNILSHQSERGILDMSFSPALSDKYGTKLTISASYQPDKIHLLFEFLSSYWQGEEDDQETSRKMATLFHEDVEQIISIKI